MVDFEGQKLAEQIFYFLIISFGGVGWVIGYIQQDFTVVFQAWLVGVVLSVIVSGAPHLPRRIARRSLWVDLTLPVVTVASIDTDLRSRLAILQPTSRQVVGFGARSAARQERLALQVLRYGPIIDIQSMCSFVQYLRRQEVVDLARNRRPQFSCRSPHSATFCTSYQQSAILGRLQ